MLSEGERECLGAQGAIVDLGAILPLAIMAAALEFLLICLDARPLMDTSLPLELRDRVHTRSNLSHASCIFCSFSRSLHRIAQLRGGDLSHQTAGPSQ